MVYKPQKIIRKYTDGSQIIVISIQLINNGQYGYLTFFAFICKNYYQVYYL